jgi:hypothetical protein
MSMKKITIKKDTSKPPSVKPKKDEYADLINKELNTFQATKPPSQQGIKILSKPVETIKTSQDNKMQIGNLGLNKNATKKNNDDLFNKSGVKFGVKIDLKHLGDNNKGNNDANNSQLNMTNSEWNTSTTKNVAFTTEKTFKDKSPGRNFIQKEIMEDFEKKNVRILLMARIKSNLI